MDDFEIIGLIKSNVKKAIESISAFTGATSEDSGAKGFVPAPATTDDEKLLCGDGSWSDKIISEEQWTEIQSILT